MKKLFLTMAFIALTFIGANAQSTNTEFYTGYQFVRTNVETRVPNRRDVTFNRATDSSGFNVSATKYLSKSVGVTGEVGANFNGSGRNLYTTMGGLTLKANRKGRVQPFVRGLGGFYTAQSQGFNSDQVKANFAYALGAGLDFRLGSKVSLRIGQVDYLATRDSGQFNHNVRVGAGLVF